MANAGAPFTTLERIEYLKLYGNTTMAFSVFQHGMEYFDLPKVGFLAYRRYGKTDFVLCNPICSDDDRRQLVGLFLDDHPKASFVQITESFSSFLREVFQFYTVQMGVETWIDSEEWSLRGPSKTHVRRWINTAKNDGLTVSEIKQMEMAVQQCVVRDEWLETRTQRKALTFLTREHYADPVLASLIRVFGGYKDNELIALLEFDPIFRENNTIGYYANVVQFKKQAPNGASDYIIATAFNEFIREGVRYLSFGMSPLAQLAPSSNEPPLIRWVGSWLYQNGNAFYNFKGNYFHKQKYRGNEVPVFYATKKWNALPDVFRLFRLIGVV